VEGPDGKTKYPVPVLEFSHHIGPSISTPVFSKNKLIAAGYNGINLFSFNEEGNFTLQKTVLGNFEASPVTDQGRVYIASRDGFLYCFGDTSKQIPVAVQPTIKKETPPVAVKKVEPVATQKVIPRPVIKKEPVHVIVANKIFNDAVLSAITRHPVDLHKVDSALIAVNVKPEVKVEIPANTFKNIPGSYHLIAGVFRSQQNAAKFEKLWKSRGMNAETFVFPNGMFYVSIADGNTENDLAPIRSSVREKYNADSWVFTREE
jgi:hypothetical protein